MKKLKILLTASFVLFGFSLTAQAGEETGTVNIQYSHYSSNATDAGVTLFYLEDGSKTGTPPTCSTYSSGERWAINNNWPAANQQLATLLAAKVSGKRVKIIGAGNCDAWGDSETARDIYLLD